MDAKAREMDSEFDRIVKTGTPYLSDFFDTLNRDTRWVPRFFFVTK